MRRLALVLVAVAAATGCDSYTYTEQPYVGGDWSGYGPNLTAGRLVSSSYIDMAFDGIALRDDSDVAFTGMAGMTCEYFTALGATGTDVDVSEGDETVDDARPSLDDPWGDSSVVLGRGEAGELHEVSMPSGQVVRSWSARGAVTARYVPEGVAVLRSEIEEGCFVEVLGQGRTHVDGHFCSGDAAVVSTPDGLILVDGGGAVEVVGGVATVLPLTGQFAAYDAMEDRLVVADAGQLRAVTRAGAVLWAANLDGQVMGLTALGDDFLASVKTDYRKSRLVVVDGAGQVVSDQTIDRSAGRVYGSPDGRKAALSSRAWSDTFIVVP
jgi:hypothetical protein